MGIRIFQQLIDDITGETLSKANMTRVKLNFIVESPVNEALGVEAWEGDYELFYSPESAGQFTAIMKELTKHAGTQIMPLINGTTLPPIAPAAEGPETESGDKPQAAPELPTTQMIRAWWIHLTQRELNTLELPNHPPTGFGRIPDAVRAKYLESH